MADYTVTTTPEEDAALQWVAGQADPPQEAAAYFDARMHDVLQSYLRQYNQATAAVPPQELGEAYLAATTAQQEEIAAILGVPVMSSRTSAAPATESNGSEAQA